MREYLTGCIVSLSHNARVSSLYLPHFCVNRRHKRVSDGNDVVVFPRYHLPLPAAGTRWTAGAPSASAPARGHCPGFATQAFFPTVDGVRHCLPHAHRAQVSDELDPTLEGACLQAPRSDLLEGVRRPKVPGHSIKCAPSPEKCYFLVPFCSGIIGRNAGHDPQEGCGAYPGRQHRAPCVTPLVFESAWVGVGHLPSPGELPPKKIWFPLTDFGWFWDGYWVRTPRPPPGWSSPACPPRPITPAEPVYFGCRAAACPLPFHRLSAGGGVPSGGLPAPNEVCAVQQGGGWFLAGVSLWFLDSGEIQGSIWVSH